LLHPGFNSANSTDIFGQTALMLAVSCRNKDVLLELVKHESVSLDLSDRAFGGRADLRLIVEDAKRMRAQVSSLAANIQSGASLSSRVTNPVANNQSGAFRLSRELGSSLSDDDSVSECRERCKQELEDLRKHQNDRVQRLLQQQEEKGQKMKLEHQKKLEESMQQLKLEIQKKEQELKRENERALSLLLEENESQEALMLAKHEGERAARKAAELQTERNAAPRPSATTQPQVPECPVCLEEMAPPTRIFQCTNGHLVCETCKTDLRPCICPKCRQEMAGRATGMELFLRSFQQS